MLRAALFLGFFLGSFAYALWRGGTPERVAALLLLAAVIASASIGVGAHQPGRFSTVEIVLALTDLLLGVALVVLAMRANRLWLIPAAACQVVAVIAHLTKLTAPGMFAGGYALLITIWAWPITGLLLFGTYCHHQRMKTGHLDRPWKRS